MKKRLLLSSIQKFIKVESLGGILLFSATLIALLWANSPWSESYRELWSYKMGFESTEFSLVKPLILWVNDGLMAVFFFLIGLEIKRELLIGELNSPKKAVFPFIAALGGMSIPALCYVLLNDSPDTASGWAIPMATDIAFSLAVLKLLGNRVPLNLKIFLTAFAIVDDLGAVMIIALFYSGGVAWSYVLAAALLLVIIYFILRNKFNKYLLFIFSVAIWYLFLKAGIHPTIAGVLVAFTVPVNRKLRLSAFVDEAKGVIQQLSTQLKPNKQALLSKDQIDLIDDLDELTDATQSPLQHLEHRLHDWVAYLVMPIFALANAGVEINADANFDMGLITRIVVALIVGNSIGITLFSWLGLKLKLTQLPEHVNMKQIIGVSFLAGVGFTMSIFISNLAFNDSILLLDSAKVGILAGSFVSGFVGYMILRWNSLSIKG